VNYDRFAYPGLGSFFVPASSLGNIHLELCLNPHNHQLFLYVFWIWVREEAIFYFYFLFSEQPFPVHWALLTLYLKFPI